MLNLKRVHTIRKIIRISLLLSLLLSLFLTGPANSFFVETKVQSSSSDFAIYLPIIIKPEPTPVDFNKYAPLTGTMGISPTPVLSWSISANATHYEYCIDTTDDGSCSNWISTGSNNYVGLYGLQQDTTYYWQVRAWNESYGPTYANGSPSQFWSFKTIQKRLVVFEGFLSSACGFCQRASVVIDQLAAAYSNEPVVFIEHDLANDSNGRYRRWWDAYYYGGGEGHSLSLALLPFTMVDSGNQISNGPVDFQSVYSSMVDTSMLRPPKVDISATWKRIGNEIETTIDITNFSDINLSYDNNATLFMIVYENARVGLTDRYVRSVVREEIASLAQGENARFILTTNEVIPADWNNINVIVIADYISDFDPDSGYKKFDTLQAVIAKQVSQ